MQIWNFKPLIWVVIIIVLARAYFVNQFAVALPFWDQWDAEGDQLLRLWAENSLHVSDLWHPHNEHRIFPTRLLGLLIFILTDQWNNLTSAYVNIILAASIPASLLFILCRFEKLANLRLLILLVIVAQFTLPFSFENMLIGFQSQFYFLILFSVCAFGVATTFQRGAWKIVGLIILSLLCIFTSASGLITSLVVAGMLALDAHLKNRLRYQEVTAIVTFIAIAAVAYITMPHIAAHDVFRADNIFEWIKAAAHILSWPTKSYFLFVLLWLPAIITMSALIRKRNFSDSDLFMAACFAWSFAQALAVAYGRGHELTSIPSRYTELLSIGLVANAWFTIRYVEQVPKLRWQNYLMLAFFPVFIFGHIKRLKADLTDMKTVHNYSVVQSANVNNYLLTQDPSHLHKPGMQIPYPDSVRLKLLLDNHSIRKMLPAPRKVE